jgi:glutathione S-transferase-like protein
VTIADWLYEQGQTHHPIANVLYYEQQTDEAKKRAANLPSTRIPKFLGYFERILKQSARRSRTELNTSLQDLTLKFGLLKFGLTLKFGCDPQVWLSGYAPANSSCDLTGAHVFAVCQQQNHGKRHRVAEEAA